MSNANCYEDFPVGTTMRTGSVTVTPAEIKTFAGQYDPQIFHLDEAGAAQTLFGELVASGWHTAGLVMGLMVRADILNGTPLVGAGVDNLRWPRPTRPGDILTAVVEVIDRRESRSRADRGILRVAVTATNQHDAVVQTFEAALVVPRRKAAAAAPAM